MDVDQVPEAPVAMEINLTLSLPRDAITVPLVRHLCRYALREIGVDDECAGDVELAVSEACANVVRHASADDDYTVGVVITGDQCEIRVVDSGRGFDFSSLEEGADDSAESGRGVQLMRALMDGIDFTSEPESGTIVHLVKQLEYGSDGPALALR